MIIYVDVLFVVNFFITYLLLLLTRVLTKSNAKTIRLLLSSFVGGLYSLVILVDSLSPLLSLFGKLLVSAVLVLVAFGIRRLALFLKSLVIFYFSNMLFLGVIAGVQLIFNTKSMAVNNGSVYFDISATVLLVSALAAYIISVVIIKLYNRTLGRNEIYKLKIYKDGECFNMLAFLDTGNKLSEPFSGYPVIIADSSRLCCRSERIIPFNTVGGDGMLHAFRPDKVEISNSKSSVETDRVYVALSDVGSKDYSAILNEQVLKM